MRALLSLVSLLGLIAASGSPVTADEPKRTEVKRDRAAAESYTEKVVVAEAVGDKILKVADDVPAFRETVKGTVTYYLLLNPNVKVPQRHLIISGDGTAWVVTDSKRYSESGFSYRVCGVTKR